MYRRFSSARLGVTVITTFLVCAAFIEPLSLASSDDIARSHVNHPNSDMRISTSTVASPLVLNGTDKILYSTGGGMHVVNADGTGDTFLGGGHYPSWSPDGTKIAFQATAGVLGNNFLFSMNADGTNRRQLNFNGTFTGNPYLSWAPDSQRIVFQVQEGAGGLTNEIYVVKYDGTGLTRLTNNSANDQAPQWSPDGSKIVFASDRADVNTDIYTMNPDGSGVQRLTFYGFASSAARSPRWSPDGTKIAFVRGLTKTVDGLTSGYNQLQVMSASGGPSVAAEFRASDITYPNWSNDSSRIAIQVINLADLANSASYTVSGNGGGAVRLALNNSNGAHDWSPDDGQIVYADRGNIYVINEDDPGSRFKVASTMPIGINQFGTPSWKPRAPCNCPTIPRPSPQLVSSNWGNHKSDWSMTATVSDADGLVLTNVRLGPRLLAEKISVPYYNFQSSLFTNRGELKPNNVEDDGSRRTRLVDYRVTQDLDKLVVEAIYAIDEIPVGSQSCLFIIQRNEFYRQGVGGPCEPSEKLPCSRWKPIVKYKFFGELGQTLSAINIPQRRHFTVDGNHDNSIGLFKDCDNPPPPPFGFGLGCGIRGLIFDRKANPLFEEWYGGVITSGSNTNVWDNIHQTQFDSVDEPNIDITLGNWSLKSPGCPECMHSHWRWGKTHGPLWGNGLAIIPPGSNQHFDFAVVKNKPGEDHPTDFTLLANNERIRRPATGFDPSRQVFDFTTPDDIVLWYSATGHQSGDAFYDFGIFFSASVPNVYLYGGPEAPEFGMDPTVAEWAFGRAQQSDELSSVVVAHVFEEGATTVTAVDPNVVGALPSGYTAYGSLSFDVDTEAKASGPSVVTFTVPSITDPAEFNKLRIFHAEQDPFEPDKVIWVDRTIVAPDPLAPDFANRTINARTRWLGPFVAAVLTTPPSAPGTADMTVSSGHAPAQVVVGNDVTYTINVANNGPATADGIRLLNSLPPNSQFVSVTPTQGTCAYNNGRVICKLGSLNNGASASLTVVVTLTETGLNIPAGGAEVRNTVDVRANETDTNLTDNTVTESVMLMPDSNLAPTVSISSPLNGKIFPGPTNVTVALNASDSDGTVSTVEVFDNGNSLGTATHITGTEYTLVWNSAPVGDHSLIAVATDDHGKKSASEVANITVNGPATVSISSPSTGKEFATGNGINITANASVSGGSITAVEFYADGELMGSGVLSGTNQYSLTWTPTYAASYTLVAIATANSGLTSISSPVEITVRNNSAPSTSIINPTNGSYFPTPGNIVITASAIDVDGALNEVAFYANGSKIGDGVALGNNQYRFTWTNPAVENYSLTTVATDDSNSSVTSMAVNISVASPPAVAITSPASSAQYTAPGTVAITTTATDSDGTIARVDFYANGLFIGTGTSTGGNQYIFNWTNVGIGSYDLTAVAVDNGGLSTASAAVSVSVTSPVLFVTNSTTLNATEQTVQTRLETLNHTVVVMTASSVLTGDATGKALVVISSTVAPSAVGMKFRTVAVPVLTWESGIYNNMGMTGSTNKDFGTKVNQTEVSITNSTHPLAAGFSGDTSVASLGAFNWGKPNANAVTVGIVVGDAAKTLLFGYETGAAMPGLTAPARRVGFFMNDNTVLNNSGIAMLDAAIRWAIGGGSLIGSVASSPSSANLTNDGLIDWAHWGRNGPTNFDHKANVPQQISNFTKLGTGGLSWFNDCPTTFSWNDGIPPTTSATTTSGSNTNGVVGNGFEITIPADGNLKTLKLYVGVWFTQAKLEATLSDGSAPSFVDTSITSTTGVNFGVYTLQYRAGSPGQTLKLRYTILQQFFAPNGNVAFEAATLR